MTPNRWWMLALGMTAQGACMLPVMTLPFLIPALQRDAGMPLGMVGLVVGAPSVGMVLLLIAWGWLADRRGERLTLTLGLSLTAVTLVVAAYVTQPGALALVLVATGAACAGGSAASGRIVLGWFPPQRRGIAMALRQAALPFAGVLAGLGVPPVVIRHGVRGAFLLCAAVCLVAAVLVLLWVVDPAWPAREQTAAASPYRRPALWRIHGASLLLVVPQFTTGVFMVAYLVGDRNWSLLAAGQLAALAQLLGAAGRLASGRWSDVVGSRVTPLRQLAVGIAATVLALALATWSDSRLAVPLLVLATAIAMSSNGLSFTAVAELAGPAWAGRALGAQNTVQNLSAAATPALLGLLIVPAGYAAAFAASGLMAVAAAMLAPAQRSL